MADLEKYENCLCFNLRRAARQISQAYDRALKPSGLRGSQFSCLAVLSHFPNGVRLSVLAERIGLDRTTLTRNIAHLERGGLVESLGEGDQRVRRLILTPRGRTRIAQAREAWAGAQSALADEYGADNTQALLALLGRLGETGIIKRAARN